LIGVKFYPARVEKDYEKRLLIAKEKRGLFAFFE
jgi:hypothetical protein